MRTINVLFRGIYLDVTGIYHAEQGGDWDTPGVGSYFEVEEVRTEDSEVDIKDLLDEHMDDIEALVLTKIED